MCSELDAAVKVHDIIFVLFMLNVECCFECRKHTIAKAGEYSGMSSKRSISSAASVSCAACYV